MRVCNERSVWLRSPAVIVMNRGRGGGGGGVASSDDISDVDALSPNRFNYTSDSDTAMHTWSRWTWVEWWWRWWWWTRDEHINLHFIMCFWASELLKLPNGWSPDYCRFRFLWKCFFQNMFQNWTSIEWKQNIF